jgi:hypothetical protein
MGESGSGDLKQVGQELVQDAKSAVSNATSEVKNQVTEMSDSVQAQASQFLDEQKGMAAERIGGVADALRQAGQELAGHDESTLAQYTNTLAEELDKFSSSLRDREIGSLIDDAKQLAYRQPEWFVAGALAAGFVIGRFFKSSRRAARQYDDSYGEYDPRGPSRMYGQQYGEPYGQEFGRSDSPQYSQGYGSGYRTGASTGYGSQSGRPDDQAARQNYGQSYGQGNEQVSNFESEKPVTNPSQQSGAQQSGSQRPTTRQGGDAA